MNDCLSHRGPDDDGYHVDGSVGLAHRRLSIIDLETGHQPIYNENGDVAVIFNGEIYNYRSLRKDLVRKGHDFDTNSDTEVLVHLYEERGLSFVERLEGMFAVALWDADAERLVLARDGMGIKPLYLAEDDGRVAFASELSAILASDVDHGGLDQRAIAQYFAFSFVPAPKSAFQNVRKLCPGELAVISDEGVERQSFYEPSVETAAPPINRAATELRDKVEHAVEKRLQSDVPLGAFLSGGVDSSAIVGTMAELSDDPVRTFTVGFDEDLFDESWAAREVADYHGTDHQEFTVSPDDVRQLVPEVLGRLGEPFADPSLLPTYVVSRETSREVKVALSGDGADELFAGYAKYRGEWLSRYYRALPSMVREYVVEPSVARLPTSRSSRAGEFGRKANKFLRGKHADIGVRHFEWMRIADARSTDAFGTISPVEAGRAAIAEQHADAAEWLPAERRDALGRIQAVDTRYGLPNQMLRKVDAASMYNSLEVRVPFLDRSVVEYAIALPTEYKITATTQKRVLKHAFDDVLPESIQKRNKQGFDMPIGEWFKNQLADEFRSTVADLNTEVLDLQEVMEIFREHRAGDGEHGKFLWSVYVFATWLKRMRAEDVLK